jgi:hypothetical protein
MYFIMLEKGIFFWILSTGALMVIKAIAAKYAGYGRSQPLRRAETFCGVIADMQKIIRSGLRPANEH